MFEFARKLLFSRKLTLERGNIQLLDQKVLIIPRQLMTRLIEVYSDQPGFEREIYRIMKESVHDFTVEVDSRHRFGRKDLLDTLINLTELNGYGLIEVENYDEDANVAAFLVKNLPSEDVADKFSFKADTYWAGMLAGGMSYIFQADVDAIETQCVTEGANQCMFIVAPADHLQEEYPDLFDEKLG